MKKRVRKTIYGCVSLRDYIVEECIAKNEDLTIQYGEKEMTIPASIVGEVGRKSTVCKSKYPPYDSYQLINFNWRPDEN